MNRLLYLALMVAIVMFFGCSNPTSSASGPATPTGLTASSANIAGGDSITITWNSVSGATSYSLYDTKDGTTPTASNYFKVYSPSTTSEYLTNVSLGTLYKFAVAAVNSAGASALSGIYTTTTPAALLVTGITISAGTPSSGSVSGSTWSIVNQGATLQLSAIVSPSNATTQTVTWTSGAPGIVGVNSTSGLVTIIAGSGNGPYTITATANDSNAVTATFIVNYTGG
jgi:hypothetical protein